MYSTSKPPNFADLMSVASKNAADASRKANVSAYDINRPKRADPKKVKLNEGVSKFLAKQAEEEQKRKLEEKVKLDKLLQLRQQDRKATNRVRKMLSMTKSANKSCVDDAKDCLNASVAAQGEIQPDEDDYGYTSKYADEMHRKMMDKYKAIPIKPTFADSGKIPIPKSQSLQKNGTGWRHKSAQDQDDGNYSDVEPYEPASVPSGKKPEKPAKAPKKPAPPDYQQLLQLATQKQMEAPAPVKIVLEKKDMREEFEYGRPMTSKEKAAFMADKELRERVARRQQDKPVPDKNNNSNQDPKKPTSFKIPNKNAAKPREEVHVPVKKARLSEPEPSVPPPRPLKEAPKPPTPAPRPQQFNKSAKSPPSGKFNGPPKQNSSPPANSQMKPRDANQERRPKYPDERDQRRPSIPDQPRAGSSQDMQMKKKLTDSSNNFKNGQASMRPNGHQQENRKLPQAAFRDGQSRNSPNARREMPPPRQSMPPGRGGMAPARKDEMPPRKAMTPRREDVPPQKRDMPPPRREEPPQKRDMPPARREMPPPARAGMQRREEPPQRKDPRREMPMKGHPGRMRDEPPRFKRPQKGRAIIDSDEEYDSEMDDFIDDSDMDGGDISAEISRIFNYDRRRFHYDEESDDECMESSVAQQMREEQRSLRIGIQEDLEDIAREEEEKKRMKMKMKRKVR